MGAFCIEEMEQRLIKVWIDVLWYLDVLSFEGDNVSK